LVTDPEDGASRANVQSALMGALDSFRDLAQGEAVGAAWDEPSVVLGYTVGGLAGHVLGATSAIERYLDLTPGDHVATTKGAYYAVVPSTADAPDLHADIRARAAALAARGQQAVIEDLDALCTRLRQRLATEPPTRVVEVMGGTILALDDYLETRVIEVVVHCDDIAVSVGATSNVPSEAASIAVSHLLEVARHRHGDIALVRAFTRRERDDIDALRVF
jgi:hypothetical protein